jgi:hypothetical protein
VKDPDVLRSIVSVLITSPDTVLGDYHRLMELASSGETPAHGREIAVHPTLAWHPFFPSCSTPPWQLDGVLGAFIGSGFSVSEVCAWYDSASGVSIHTGRVLNRHDPVLARYGIRVFADDGGERRALHRPRTPLRVLQRVFPDGIPVPERLIGRFLIHLPTLKTRRDTIVSGAAVSALECWLGKEARRLGDSIHEALADILAVQKELSPGALSFMDGVFAGEGPEPRDLVPHEKNVILASADPVALDSVALTLMGFDPMGAGYIRMAHEAGIGSGEPEDIELAGDDISGMRFGFSIVEPPGAQMVRTLERAAFGTVLGPAARLVSTVYHDWYRYLAFGEERIKQAMSGEWGKVFESYRR